MQWLASWLSEWLYDRIGWGIWSVTCWLRRLYHHHHRPNSYHIYYFFSFKFCHVIYSCYIYFVLFFRFSLRCIETFYDLRRMRRSTRRKRISFRYIKIKRLWFRIRIRKKENRSLPFISKDRQYRRRRTFICLGLAFSYPSVTSVLKVFAWGEKFYLSFVLRLLAFTFIFRGKLFGCVYLPSFIRTYLLIVLLSWCVVS